MANPTSLEATHEQLLELFALAASYNGNIARAARELGHVEDTARRWRRRERELYNSVAKQELENIRQQTAERHLEVAEQATDLEAVVIDNIRTALEKGTFQTRDLPTVARNLATEAGIHTDKAIDLLGLKDKSAVGIQVNLDLGGMVNSMAAKGTKFFDSEGNEVDPKAIDSTGTQIDE